MGEPGSVGEEGDDDDLVTTFDCERPRDVHERLDRRLRSRQGKDRADRPRSRRVVAPEVGILRKAAPVQILQRRPGLDTRSR